MVALDLGLGPEKSAKRRRPERDDHARSHDSNLHVEIRRAGSDLVTPRRPILAAVGIHRMTEDRVRDESILASYPGFDEKCIQDQSRPSNERTTLTVLVLARGLAKQQQPGRPAALSKDDLRPPSCERTPATRERRGAEGLEAKRDVRPTRTQFGAPDAVAKNRTRQRLRLSSRSFGACAGRSRGAPRLPRGVSPRVVGFERGSWGRCEQIASKRMENPAWGALGKTSAAAGTKESGSPSASARRPHHH